MSEWLNASAQNNMRVRLRGPFGTCYYSNPDCLSFDIVLVGTGTGLAPLIGIIRSAINQCHEGSITLRQDEDIYLAETIHALQERHPQFHFDPCVLKTDGLYPEASIEQRLLLHLSNLL